MAVDDGAGDVDEVAVGGARVFARRSARLISGPDAFRLTNMLISRNFERSAVDQCKYAFITDERGGIINDPVLLRLRESHLCPSLADSYVLLWANGVAYHAGMRVTITEPDVGPLQLDDRARAGAGLHRPGRAARGRNAGRHPKARRRRARQGRGSALTATA